MLRRTPYVAAVMIISAKKIINNKMAKDCLFISANSLSNGMPILNVIAESKPSLAINRLTKTRV